MGTTKYLTSNTFFGRKQALKIGFRQKFKSVAEMNEALIEIWNSTVSNDDIVYHLGGFAQDPLTATSVLDKLNGKIVFLNTELDASILDIAHIFDNMSIIDSFKLNLVPEKTVLSYYPFEVWDDMTAIHFYGDERIPTDLTKVPNRMNVSFNIWKKPVAIDLCLNLINDVNSHAK